MRQSNDVSGVLVSSLYVCIIVPLFGVCTLDTREIMQTVNVGLNECVFRMKSGLGVSWKVVLNGYWLVFCFCLCLRKG